MKKISGEEMCIEKIPFLKKWLRDFIDASLIHPWQRIDMPDVLKLNAILSALDGPSEIRPKIVCFCGSSRFIDTFGIFMWEYEKAGNIALGLHWIPPSYRDELNKPAADDHQAEAEGIAEKMDELHLRKIDLADEIFILNVGGYIGESTRKEIEYAAKLGKRIKYLEPVGNPAPGKEEK